MNNNEIFEEFWNNYVWPESVPVFYRLYYNDAGEPVVYSMEDLPGKYIEITSEQFAASNPHVRVREGKLVLLQFARTSKLIPSDSGTPCDPYNITIVVDENQNSQRWNLKHYENN
jgi:hypothetical protein